MTSIAIIGGGVIGLCCAVALTRSGANVTVFDPLTDRSAASWGNAGHIAVEQTSPLASLTEIASAPRRLFALGGALDFPVAAFSDWLPFAAQMAASSTPARFESGKAALTALLADALPAWLKMAESLGQPELVRPDGHYIVWESERTARSGSRRWLGTDIGVAVARSARRHEFEALATLSSIPLRGAVRIDGSGQIADLSALAAALEAAVITSGGQIVRQAADLAVEDGKAVIAGNHADLILLTAGVGSAQLLRRLGVRVPLVAERGYHVRANAGQWPASMPPVVFEDRSMIVTRYREQVQASSFVEFNRADARPDPRKWARLERHVAQLGLPFGNERTRWVGSRPTLPDYLPAIGRSRRASNLIYAFGHQHLGLTLAPVTASLVAALVNGSQPSIDLRPFDLQRFDRAG